MSSRIVVRTVREADLAAVRDLITKAFVYREPTGRHLGITEPEFYKFYDSFAPNIDFNTSTVAELVHPSDDTTRPPELISCHVNTPLAVALNLEEMKPVVQLYDDLYEPFGEVLKRNGISSDRVLHSLMGATKEEYHGKGVYKQVLEMFAQQTMNDSRWDAAVADCTSPVTRHLKMKQLGWVEENYIRYEDYVVDGQRPLLGLEGGISLVWKDYRIQLATAGTQHAQSL